MSTLHEAEDAVAGALEGKIVAWGDPAFAQLWERWCVRFRQLHPAVIFDHFLVGSSTAVGALYTGTAQIGLLGRELRRLERVSWKRVFRHQPVVLAIATGSYAAFGKTVAVAVLVNHDNPMTHITLKQLDAIYSRERRRGAAEAVTKWGQLGLTGDWAERPITVYGLDEDTGTANHLQARVLQHAPWSHNVQLPPGAPTEMYAGSGGDAADALVAALERDRLAIGLAGYRNLTPRLKALAIAEDEGGPFVEGTEETVASRRYPLSRSVYLAVSKQPEDAWDPALREFIRFVLSAEGQQVVAEEGEYLPLPPEVATAELKKIEE